MVIVAAVDGETVPDQVVEIGHDLATSHGEELLVVHVLTQELFEEQRAASSEGGTPLAGKLAPDLKYTRGQSSSSDIGSERPEYNMSDGQRDAKGIARSVVDETLADTTGVSCVGKVGEPVKEILAETDKQDARYLVIGGRKRTPVGKAVFGSFTQSVLLNADSPVMTVMTGE